MCFFREAEPPNAFQNSVLERTDPRNPVSPEAEFRSFSVWPGYNESNWESSDGQIGNLAYGSWERLSKSGSC